jgi:hypothetical protein
VGGDPESSLDQCPLSKCFTANTYPKCPRGHFFARISIIHTGLSAPRCPTGTLSKFIPVYPYQKSRRRVSPPTIKPYPPNCRINHSTKNKPTPLQTPPGNPGNVWKEVGSTISRFTAKYQNGRSSSSSAVPPSEEISGPENPPLAFGPFCSFANPPPPAAPPLAAPPSPSSRRPSSIS